MSDKERRLKKLEEDNKKLRRDLDFIMNSHNLYSNHDRIADVNNRVREAMSIIADKLNISLNALFDSMERRR